MPGVKPGADVGAPVRVEYTKWDSSPHWEYDAIWLGADAHGDWLGVKQGTRQARPGLSVSAAADHVALVTLPGDHSVTFNFDRAATSCEVYVDITCSHSWRGTTMAMVDLDLDVIRFWDGRIVIDDEDEFADHRVRLGYPNPIAEAALAASRSAQKRLRTRTSPFDGAAAGQWLGVLMESANS